MTKVSFDYDQTLTESEIQDFAKECIEADHEVWIVTSRKPDRKAGNQDLYDLADELGIAHDCVAFTARKPKRDFFKNESDFAFHLDNEYLEVLRINKLDPAIGIWYAYSEDWKDKCRDAMQELA